jgi:hypothetical protein
VNHVDLLPPYSEVRSTDIGIVSFARLWIEVSDKSTDFLTVMG